MIDAVLSNKDIFKTVNVLETIESTKVIGGYGVHINSSGNEVKRGRFRAVTYVDDGKDMFSSA